MRLRLRRFGLAILAWGAVFASANALAGSQYDQCPKIEDGDRCSGNEECGSGGICKAGSCSNVQKGQAKPQCIADIDNAKSLCSKNKGKRADCDTQCAFVNDNHIGVWQQSRDIVSCYKEAQAGSTKPYSGDPIKDATTRRSQMLTAQNEIEGMVDEARRKKDVVKLSCLNDKLVQMRGHLTVAGKSIADLNAATAKGDNGAAAHEGARIEILSEKVQTLYTEAKNCAGVEAQYVGNTSVDVWIDPNIPNDDPTEPPLPLPDVTRPPEASPFI